MSVRVIMYFGSNGIYSTLEVLVIISRSELFAQGKITMAHYFILRVSVRNHGDVTSQR